MAEELDANLVALHVGSNHVLNAIGEAAIAFLGHEDALADAAPSWVGSSQVALAQLAQRWEARHNQHKLQVGGLGSHVAEAMVNYGATEDSSARALRSVRG